MRITNELVIRGEQPHIRRLLAQVEPLLRDGWKRDREAEERLDQHGGSSRWAYCFSCTKKADRPAAAFWIRARTHNEWYTSSVIPRERERLDEAEKHRLLTEFQRDFLSPVAAEVGVETELVQHRQTVEDELSSEAARLLRAFSSSANRAHLSTNDRRRWNAFLVRVHQDEALFDPAALDEWLQEEGWPKDTRCQLVRECEASRSLLLAYDEEAARR